jgi:hypothetical protein
MIAGLSEQEYIDPRNETAILTARKVVKLMETGALPVGLYLIKTSSQQSGGAGYSLSIAYTAYLFWRIQQSLKIKTHQQT